MDIERINQHQNDPAGQRPGWPRGGPSEPRTRPRRRRTRSACARRPTRWRSRTARASWRRARQAVDAAPDVRADKVAAIKKRIEDGTYSVSPELLARKLLEGSDG